MENFIKDAMTVEEADQRARALYGEKYGWAWIDGSGRHEVGFFDCADIDKAGWVRTGNANTFEEAFQEAESDESKRRVSMFHPEKVC